jgi:hypothetical protein
MMAALLGLYVVVGLSSRKVTWREALRLFVMGSVVALLMLLFMHEAVSDPRAGSFSFNPFGGLQELARDFYSYRSPIVIFMDGPFGLAPSPYRMLVLVGCAACTWILSKASLQTALGRAALIYAGAIFVSLSFGYGIVPAGIQLDYVRWFLWTLQAALMTTTLVAAALYAGTVSGLRRGVVLAGLCLVAGYGAATMWKDGKVEFLQNKADAISRTELRAIGNAIGPGASEKRCGIIGDSDSFPSTLTTVQRLRAWNYAEAIAPCDFLNGSWIQPGIPNGRDFKGFPSAGALRAVATDRPLFFVGSSDAFRGYQDYLEVAQLRWRWTPLGDVAGEMVWRHDPR